MNEVRDLTNDVDQHNEDAEKEGEKWVLELFAVERHELGHLNAIPDGRREREMATQRCEEQTHVVAEFGR